MIRVLLAHFSRLVCDSLRSALHEKQNIYVAGCASTAEELQFLLPHGQVVLLGESLVDAKALEMLHRIHNVHPQTKVIVFGISEQIEKIVRYIEAGAVGYILQNESMDDLVQKLLAAQANEAIISPAVAAAMMDRLNELTHQKPSFALIQARKTPLKELTLRERQVITLLNEGYTNKEIAMALVIDCGTVKNHVHNILKKLGAANRHEAATIYDIFQSEDEPLRPYKVQAPRFTFQPSI